MGNAIEPVKAKARYTVGMNHDGGVAGDQPRARRGLVAMQTLTEIRRLLDDWGCARTSSGRTSGRSEPHHKAGGYVGRQAGRCRARGGAGHGTMTEELLIAVRGRGVRAWTRIWRAYCVSGWVSTSDSRSSRAIVWHRSTRSRGDGGAWRACFGLWRICLMEP